MTDVGEIGGEPHVNPTASQEQDHIAKRAEEAAEKTNFGDSNSEHGVGGETKIDQEGLTDSNTAEGDAIQSRREQGYGAGSGVGG
ncbi:hypothetical protein MMC09_003866 [Bachmanniomyces sp. S44760]|nr:hypothetical protein [Bachmanniomyces sp. S44760]